MICSQSLCPPLTLIPVAGTGPMLVIQQNLTSRIYSGGFRVIIKLTFVLAVKRNHSSSITPAATASIQAVVAAAASPFTRPCWSIICHRYCPHHTERRAKSRLHLCPERETGTWSVCRTARRRAMVERGARANWCSSQTEGGGEETDGAGRKPARWGREITG